MKTQFKKWRDFIYHHLVEINDTPHRKALGLGLGVFLGNFPGLGTVAALVAAFIFNANRAAALLGSLLTNTWLTVVTLAISLRTGSWVLGRDVLKVQEEWNAFLKDFHWHKLGDATVINTLTSLFLGFFLVSLMLGVFVYVLSFVFLTKREEQLKSKIP